VLKLAVMEKNLRKLLVCSDRQQYVSANRPVSLKVSLRTRFLMQCSTLVQFCSDFMITTYRVHHVSHPFF